MNEGVLVHFISLALAFYNIFFFLIFFGAACLLFVKCHATPPGVARAQRPTRMMRLLMRRRVFVLVLITSLISRGASLAPVAARGHAVDVEVTKHPHPSGRDDGTILDKFRVDLDDPPRQRWKHVMMANKEKARVTMSYLFSSLPKTVHAEINVLVSNAEARLPLWAREEMLGVADVLNVTFGDVVVVNLFFEITPFCTSIVSQSAASGKIYHARNMDFGLAMPELSASLRDIAVDVEFWKAGKLAFSATTFAGYVGVATGMRAGAFSITANEREMTGSIPIPNIFKSLINLVGILMKTDAYPVTWAVRELLEDGKTDFDGAVSVLGARKFATQMYLTVGGVSPGEGVVLTRGRNELLDTWRIDADAGQWFLVQTNYDHWIPMPPWDNRKVPAEKAITEVGAEEISPVTIYERVLSRDPVLNELTVYSTSMSCSEGTYESRVRDCPKCSPFR